MVPGMRYQPSAYWSASSSAARPTVPADRILSAMVQPVVVVLVLMSMALELKWAALRLQV